MERMRRFRGICTKDIKRQTYKLLGITLNDLKHGASIDDALKVVQSSWNESDCIILWSNDALNMMKSVCARKGISLTNTTIIILQDLLAEILQERKCLSFESALLKFGAEYERAQMHNARADVEGLKSLFDIVCDKCRSVLLQDATSSLVESIGSKIVHKRDCKYVAQIRESNINSVPVYKILSGKKLCKCCMPNRLHIELNSADEGEYKKIKYARNLKGKRVKQEQIGLLAEYFRLSWIHGHEYILVTTEYSTWKIYYAEGYVTRLDHENYKGKNNRRGYHNQHIRTRDMFSVMEYIVHHDKNPHKKKRIDELEKSFAREAKRKRMQKERRLYDEDWKNWKQN